MKNFLFTVALVLAAGAIACGAFFRWHCNDALHAAAQQRDAMAWLRTEFHLSDTQFAAIAKLQAEYGVECGQHCTAIMAAQRELASLQQTGPADAAALEAARRKLTDVERTCTDAMRAYLRKVAAIMPPAEGERYLQMLLPRVDNYRHQGAPTVRLDG